VVEIIKNGKYSVQFVALIVSKMKVISQDSKNKHMFMVKVGVKIFWSRTSCINNLKGFLKFFPLHQNINENIFVFLP